MGIIVPRHLTETPVYFCTICDSRFYEDERHQYERHVLSHPVEDLVPHSLAMQNPVLFGDAGGDQDWAAWVKRHAETDPNGWAKWGLTGDGKHSSGLGDG